MTSRLTGSGRTSRSSATHRRGPDRGRTAARGRRGAPAGRATPVDLLADAHRGLDAAMRGATAAERYAAAHHAGLRAASALLAAAGTPAGNVWTGLRRIAPDLADWADFYAAGAAKRQLAEAGITRTIGPDETTALIRRTGTFLDVVETWIAAQSSEQRGVVASR